MRIVWNYVGIGLAGTLVAGFGVVAFISLHTADESLAKAGKLAPPTASASTAGKALSLNAAAKPKPSPGINVVPNGNQGTMLNSSSGSTDGQTAAKLPEPSGFGVYDTYKTATDTLVADVVSGSGAAVAKGSVTTANYKAYLTDGTNFDDTYAKNKPFVFTEASGSVIAGFLEGMLGMQVGGTRRLIIPPVLAYGTKGEGPIPPNAVLVFDVQLISVK